jgi:hypothetical protein
MQDSAKQCKYVQVPLGIASGNTHLTPEVSHKTNVSATELMDQDLARQELNRQGALETNLLRFEFVLARVFPLPYC